MLSIFKIMNLSRYAISCLICVLTFQACYSVGPVLLSYIIGKNFDIDTIKIAIIVFIGLYFLPYPITYLAALLKVMWKSDARKMFYQQVLIRTFGKINNTNDPLRRDEFSALISSNGQQIVSDVVDFLYSMTSMLASSGVSVLLISLYVLKGFYICYFISALLCAVVTYKMGHLQTDSAHQAEKAFNKFISTLPNSWLANSLGEPVLMERHSAIFHRLWKTYRGYALRATHTFQTFSLVQAVSIWGPTTILIVYQLKEMPLSNILAFAVILPRITETLLDVSGIVSNFGQYLSLKGRINWLNETLNKQSQTNSEKHITFRKLKLVQIYQDKRNNLEFSSVKELFELLPPSGRFRLEGDNGAGKSTIMIILKSMFGDSALYVPAKELIFPIKYIGLSDGQRKQKDIQQLFKIFASKKHVLLLDEWDTNLDLQNAQLVSKQIDELAQIILVIEVSHRASSSTS